MKINLVDFIYAFPSETRVEVLDHYDDERIFSGTAEDVIRMINRSDYSYTIDLGRPYNYAEVKSGRLVVYPDYKATY
jgi:hypothetical protein